MLSVIIYYFTLPFIFFIGFLGLEVESFCSLVVVFLCFYLRGIGFYFLEELGVLVFLMVLLTMVIFLFSYLYIYYSEGEFCLTDKGFVVGSFFLLLILVFLFQVKSFLIFYILFEFSVFPIFMMICGWGLNYERMSAGFFMLLYTFIFSLPFLYVIMNFSTVGNSLSMIVSFFLYCSFLDYFEVFLSLLVFLVKLPSYFFHVWLPSAHVEAPVYGSMILAGILLKLGGYGLLVWLVFIYYQFMEISFCFFTLGVWGMLLSSFCCFIQVDLKKMIAFMSVIHMSMIIICVSLPMVISFWGVLLMMLSHGLSSSMLFFILNCLYERCHSRSILVLKSVGALIPFFSFWCFLGIIVNVGIPPFLSFFSEVILMWLVFLNSNFLSVLVLFSLFMGALCSLLFYIYLCHGISNFLLFYQNIQVKEHIVMFFHIYFLISTIYFI